MTNLAQYVCGVGSTGRNERTLGTTFGISMVRLGNVPEKLNEMMLNGSLNLVDQAKRHFEPIFGNPHPFFPPILYHTREKYIKGRICRE